MSECRDAMIRKLSKLPAKYDILKVLHSWCNLFVLMRGSFEIFGISKMLGDIKGDAQLFEDLIGT